LASGGTGPAAPDLSWVLSRVDDGTVRGVADPAAPRGPAGSLGRQPGHAATLAPAHAAWTDARRSILG